MAIRAAGDARETYYQSPWPNESFRFLGGMYQKKNAYLYVSVLAKNSRYVVVGLVESRDISSRITDTSVRY